MRISAPALTLMLVLGGLAVAPAARQAAGNGAQQPAAPATPPPEAAQPAQTDAQQPPRIRTGINYVRVDVIVSDKSGAPVNDLRQQDFEITEDGKPQTIQAFKLVNITETSAATPVSVPRRIKTIADEQMAAAKDDVRLFGIFLDDYHVRLENSMRAREPIARFVENQLFASDLVSLMYPLTPLTDVLLTEEQTAPRQVKRELTKGKCLV